MPDWRWVTSIRRVPVPGNAIPLRDEGMWIDFDGLDAVMPLQPDRYVGARTRLGWMTNEGWRYMFIAEQIDPTERNE